MQRDTLDQEDVLQMASSSYQFRTGHPLTPLRAFKRILHQELGGKMHFWRKDMWPPQSPDLNPLDYGVTGAFYRQKVQMRVSSQSGRH